MKRLIRINNRAVAPALTLLLVIPIIIAIVTALALWSQNMVNNMDKTQDTLHEIRDELDNIDFADLINKTRIIYNDD